MFKFRTLLLLFAICINFIYTQIKSDSNHIVIGKVDSIQSHILNENRKLWIHVPNDSPKNEEKYPVVYLLDGDWHFSAVVGLTQQMSQTGVSPKMIIVGITNTDRNRDMTPTAIDPKINPDLPYLTESDSLNYKTSGGAKNFIAFIEKELMPYVENKYPTAPHKTFVGHSLGGLLVMQTILYHEYLFNSYICIDPSMWYDKGKLLNEAHGILTTKKFENKSLYLGFANTLEDDIDINSVKNDTSDNSKHIRNILKLHEAFEQNKQNGLRYFGKYYPEDNHGSVSLIANYDAFRFFFDFYPLNLTMKDYQDVSGNMAIKYKKHFENISNKMGYKIRPNQDEINFLAYDFLNRKMFNTSDSFFKLNIDNFPDNFEVYDAYAEYFVSLKDKTNAIIQLKKALAIKENKSSREKLDALKN